LARVKVSRRRLTQLKAEGKIPVVTTPQAALERRVVQLANGKEAAVEIQEESDTEIKARLLDEQGEPTKQTVTISKVAAAKPVEAPAPNVAAESAVTDGPTSDPSETPQPAAPAKPKAAIQKTAVETLPDVLEMH
jgi:hypothetical protein